MCLHLLTPAYTPTVLTRDPGHFGGPHFLTTVSARSLQRNRLCRAIVNIQQGCTYTALLYPALA